MDVFRILILSLLCGLVYSSGREARSGFPTECCICDDASNVESQRCSSPNVCSNSFRLCTEYCHTTKQYVSGAWRTSRSCGTEATCMNDWYHTTSTIGCMDMTHGVPQPGTTCYSCCRTPSASQPHYCQEDADTNYIRFNFTARPSPPTTTTTTTTTTPSTTTSTTPTTTPTTTTTTTTPAPTTTTTTIATTTTTTASTTTTAATTPTTSVTVPTTTQTPGTVCEVCTSANCTSPRTVTCAHGEDFCLNTITTRDNGETSIKKECSSSTQCYYDAYIFMKSVTDCQQAKVSGSFHDKGICHYCCKGTGNQACNRDVIPYNVYNFENPNATHCLVGRDGAYSRRECNAATPLCMNTIIRSKGTKIVKKSCEDEIVCNTDWWRNSRTRAECKSTEISALNQTLQTSGVVCHYCCNSVNGSTCNTDDLPPEVLSKFQVDGQWGSWQSWNGCSPSCEGIRIRIRTCSEPYPKNGGMQCPGTAFQQEVCPKNCHGSGVAIIG